MIWTCFAPDSFRTSFAEVITSLLLSFQTRNRFLKRPFADFQYVRKSVIGIHAWAQAIVLCAILVGNSLSQPICSTVGAQAGHSMKLHLRFSFNDAKCPIFTFRSHLGSGICLSAENAWRRGLEMEVACCSGVMKVFYTWYDDGAFSLVFSWLGFAILTISGKSGPWIQTIHKPPFSAPFVALLGIPWQLFELKPKSSHKDRLASRHPGLLEPGCLSKSLPENKRQEQEQVL